MIWRITKLIARTLRASARRRGRILISGLTLVETLVVVAIIASVAGLISFAVNQTLRTQNERTCFTNMVNIEAAKDEYLRDHPQATNVASIDELRPYLRFGVPRCPALKEVDYANELDLTQPVQCQCPLHTKNNTDIKAAR